MGFHGSLSLDLSLLFSLVSSLVAIISVELGCLQVFCSFPRCKNLVRLNLYRILLFVYVLKLSVHLKESKICN